MRECDLEDFKVRVHELNVFLATGISNCSAVEKAAQGRPGGTSDAAMERGETAARLRGRVMDKIDEFPELVREYEQLEAYLVAATRRRLRAQNK